MLSKLKEVLGSPGFGRVLQVVILVCSYIFSISMLVCGVIVLATGGLSLGVSALAAAVIFWPHFDFPTWARFLFGIFVVVFLL